MERGREDINDQRSIQTDPIFDTQSVASKRNYLARSNRNHGCKAYQRILSRSRKANSISSDFSPNHLETEKSFIVEPSKIRRIVKILSNLVNKRLEKSMEKMGSQLEESTSFSFDGNGTYWSRVQDELERKEKQNNALLNKRSKCVEFINLTRRKAFLKRLTSKINPNINKSSLKKQKKTEKKKPDRILQDRINISQAQQTPKSINSIKKKLNLVKKTLKNTRNMIDKQLDKTNKTQFLTDRTNTEFMLCKTSRDNISTSRNQTQRHNYPQYQGTYTPVGATTTRSYSGSLWNDEIMQTTNTKSRIIQRNQEVVVHNIIQPIIHHIYHPVSYQNQTYQYVNQTKFQPVLIPRHRGSINQNIGRYLSNLSQGPSGNFTKYSVHRAPIGSVFATTPQYQKPNYY